MRLGLTRRARRKAASSPGQAFGPGPTPNHACSPPRAVPSAWRATSRSSSSRRVASIRASPTRSTSGSNGSPRGPVSSSSRGPCGRAGTPGGRGRALRSGRGSDPPLGLQFRSERGGVRIPAAAETCSGRAERGLGNGGTRARDRDDGSGSARARGCPARPRRERGEGAVREPGCERDAASKGARDGDRRSAAGTARRVVCGSWARRRNRQNVVGRTERTEAAPLRRNRG
jgi:hypothetical protein